MIVYLCIYHRRESVDFAIFTLANILLRCCPTCGPSGHVRYHRQASASGEKENHRQPEQAWQCAWHVAKAALHVPISGLRRGQDPFEVPVPFAQPLVARCVTPQLPGTTVVPSMDGGGRPRLSLWLSLTLSTAAASRGKCGTPLATTP